MTVWLFALAWLLFAPLGAYVASARRRRLIEGLLLGVLYGPIGVAVVATLPTGPNRRRRPWHEALRPVDRAVNDRFESEVAAAVRDGPVAPHHPVSPICAEDLAGDDWGGQATANALDWRSRQRDARND
ncbi:MAG: hypothetical protein KGM43_10165 [Planctomycetota bacterium]|nr:hypothetical protein [Planctomycetota bacterium]